MHSQHTLTATAADCPNTCKVALPLVLWLNCSLPDHTMTFVEAAVLSMNQSIVILAIIIYMSSGQHGASIEPQLLTM